LALAALAAWGGVSLAAAGGTALAAEEAPPKPLETPTMVWTLGAEIGYRTLDIEGSDSLYQSHTNLDEGARLFNLSLRGTPKGQASRFLDTLQIDAGGLGGDPQQWGRFSMRKRGVYRWDVNYNRSEYVFDVPDFTRFNQHANNNRRRTFDTLAEFNPGNTRVYVGYARREFDGPTFSSQDLARDEFLVFGPVDRQTDDARAGVDFKAGRWSLSLEQSYRKLDSQSDFTLPPGAEAGNNPANNTALTSFSRAVPLKGTYWITRASAQAAFADRVDLSIRLVHSDGETDGSSFQSAAGNYFSGAAAPFTETIATDFASELPSSLAEIGVSIRLGDRVSLHNVLRYHDYEIEGETEEDLDRDVNGTITSTVETFSRLTDWTSWELRTEAEWRVNDHWSLRGGVRRLGRDVSFEARTDGTLDDAEEGDQSADTFFASAAFRLNRKWSAFLELQDGQVDNVFLRVDPADYRLARLRGTYKPGERWALSLSTILRHGENPNPSVENRTDARTYAITAEFTGKKLAASTGYTAVNVDSTTDIVFCVGSPCTQTAAVSAWSLADNHYFADVVYRFTPWLRASLRGRMTDSRDTFPVDDYYVEPRLSVRLHGGYWLNAAWYRYAFDRGQDNTQDYRADGTLFSVSAAY
jgi:hypothetical protein